MTTTITSKQSSLDERRAKFTAWALTFADLVTLLLTFFVLLLVILNDAEKYIDDVINKLLDETYEEMEQSLSSETTSVERVTKGIKITIRGNLFKSTSADVEPEYYPVIHRIGKIIRESEVINLFDDKDYANLLDLIDKKGQQLDVEVRCEGHTDDAKLPPNADYPSNWELSASRSLNIVRLMNKYAALPEKYFSAMGYGEFRPIIDVKSISNYDEKNKARAINRRVEIYLDAFLKQKVRSEIEINI
ncbi:MAG: OmpA family protein [Candidatus Marinimicrobia bacterium]|nr:OmpA family protein [Candidatus Neomarinimicrobiota bacterium]